MIPARSSSAQPSGAEEVQEVLKKKNALQYVRR